MSYIVFSNSGDQTKHLLKKYARSQFFCVKNKNSEFITSCEGASQVCGYRNPIDFLGKTDFDMRCPATRLSEAWRQEDQMIIKSKAHKNYVCIAMFHKTGIKVLNYTKEYNAGDIIINLNELVSGPLYNYCQHFILKVPAAKRQQIHLIYEIIQHYDALTRRESEIIFLLSHQLSAKQIAALLHRSTRTIHHTIDNIRLKLSCPTSSDLIQLAHFMGWKMKVPMSLCDRTILTSLMVP